MCDGTGMTYFCTSLGVSGSKALPCSCVCSGEGCLRYLGCSTSSWRPFTSPGWAGIGLLWVPLERSCGILGGLGHKTLLLALCFHGLVQHLNLLIGAFSQSLTPCEGFLLSLPSLCKGHINLGGISGLCHTQHFFSIWFLWLNKHQKYLIIWIVCLFPLGEKKLNRKKPMELIKEMKEK